MKHSALIDSSRAHCQVSIKWWAATTGCSACSAREAAVAFMTALAEDVARGSVEVSDIYAVRDARLASSGVNAKLPRGRPRWAHATPSASSEGTVVISVLFFVLCYFVSDYDSRCQGHVHCQLVVREAAGSWTCTIPASKRWNRRP